MDDCKDSFAQFSSSLRRLGIELGIPVLQLTPSKEERIWTGRLHVGATPDPETDATYAGLSVELPFTLHGPGEGVSGPAQIVLLTENAASPDEYSGHEVILVLHEPEEPGNPLRGFRESILERAWLTSSSQDRLGLEFRLDGMQFPAYLTLRVRVSAITLPPDERGGFLIRELLLEAPVQDMVKATFGFSSPPN